MNAGQIYTKERTISKTGKSQNEYIEREVRGPEVNKELCNATAKRKDPLFSSFHLLSQNQ